MRPVSAPETPLIPPGPLSLSPSLRPLRPFRAISVRKTAALLNGRRAIGPGARLDPNPACVQRQGAGSAREAEGGGRPLRCRFAADLAAQAARDRPRLVDGTAEQQLLELGPGRAELGRGDVAQGGAGKPAKLLLGRANALTMPAFPEPSNIEPSNMPGRPTKKRRKTAISGASWIPGLARPPRPSPAGAERDQHGRSRPGAPPAATGATAPESFAAHPLQDTANRALATRRPISALYFIRRPRETARRGGRGAQRFPSSQAATAEGTARKLPNRLNTHRNRP